MSLRKLFSPRLDPVGKDSIDSELTAIVFAAIVPSLSLPTAPSQYLGRDIWWQS